MHKRCGRSSNIGMVGSQPVSQVFLRGDEMIKESWTVGDILITRVCEAEVAIPGGPGSMLPDATPAALSEMAWLRPHFVTEEYHLVMSIHALLIQSPDARLIVDTCVGNNKQETWRISII